MSTNGSERTIALIKDWSLTQLTMHFQGEDLREDDKPFAANMIVQLRMDVPSGSATAAVRENDLMSVKSRLPGLELVEQGPLELEDGTTAERIEWTISDPDFDKLRQMIVYIEDGERLYTVTGTHRDDRFENVRGDILAYCRSLSS